VEPERAIPRAAWVLCLLAPPLLAVALGVLQIMAADVRAGGSGALLLGTIAGPLFVWALAAAYASVASAPLYDRLWLVVAVFVVAAISAYVGFLLTGEAWLIGCDGAAGCPF
jgi:hypothetical protein